MNQRQFQKTYQTDRIIELRFRAADLVKEQIAEQAIQMTTIQGYNHPTKKGKY